MIQGVFNPIGVGGYGDGRIRCAKRVGWCVEVTVRHFREYKRQFLRRPIASIFVQDDEKDVQL